MEKSTNLVKEYNSATEVRPLTTLDFGARLIDNATKAKYPDTPEIIKCYTRLSTSITSLDEVTKLNCSEDEITCNKKAVYTSYNELVNEIQNFLNSHADEEARFYLRDLIMKYGHYRRYA